MPKIEIMINGKAYPCRQTMGAMLRFKQETGKSVWLFSGYTFEEAIQRKERREILTYCDVLVDGRFDLAQKDVRLRFRGSKNQRIIDVQRSLNQREVVLHEFNECLF